VLRGRERNKAQDEAHLNSFNIKKGMRVWPLVQQNKVHDQI
jgi:hypothetical protein